MKIAHISDLHLGKNLHSFSLIDDQEYILLEIIKILREKKVDVILIAGDIYDKILPSVEAIRLLRKFINELVQAKIKIFIISGNHDSAERLTFGAEFMTKNDIYFSKIFDGKIEPIVINDDYGKINFYKKHGYQLAFSLMQFVYTPFYFFQEEPTFSFINLSNDF